LPKPEAVVAAAKDIGGDTIGLVADVARATDIEQAFAKIREQVGRVDILFANAGTRHDP
jgi:NAD(P)-dependent dehydrogenase (short-subunit alcohol dehydrogenase family)